MTLAYGLTVVLTNQIWKKITSTLFWVIKGWNFCLVWGGNHLQCLQLPAGEICAGHSCRDLIIHVAALPACSMLYKQTVSGIHVLQLPWVQRLLVCLCSTLAPERRRDPSLRKLPLAGILIWTSSGRAVLETGIFMPLTVCAAVCWGWDGPPYWL